MSEPQSDLERLLGYIADGTLRIEENGIRNTKTGEFVEFYKYPEEDSGNDSAHLFQPDE